MILMMILANGTVEKEKYIIKNIFNDLYTNNNINDNIKQYMKNIINEYNKYNK